MGFSSGHSTGELFLSLFPRSNRKLEMLVFKEGGKPEDPEQNPRSKDEQQQPTQSRGTRSFRTHGRFAPSRFAAKCSRFVPNLSRFAPKPNRLSIRIQTAD